MKSFKIYFMIYLAITIILLFDIFSVWKKLSFFTTLREKDYDFQFQFRENKLFFP